MLSSPLVESAKYTVCSESGTTVRLFSFVLWFVYVLGDLGVLASESDLDRCRRRSVCEERRVRVWALRGSRPGRTDFLFYIVYTGGCGKGVVLWGASRVGGGGQGRGGGWLSAVRGVERRS